MSEENTQNTTVDWAGAAQSRVCAIGGETEKLPGILYLHLKSTSKNNPNGQRYSVQ